MHHPLLPIATALAVLASGCARHVALTAPPKTAPLEMRRQAYDELKLRPVGYRASTTASGTTTVSEIWELGDDTRIYHVTDLEQVVDGGSDTAHHIDDYRHAHEPYHYLTWVSLGLLVGGAALAFHGIDQQNWITGGSGGLALLASPVVFMSYKFASAVKRGQYAQEVKRSYNDDLRAHLGLQLTTEFRDRQRQIETGEAVDTSGFRDTNEDQ